MRPVQARGPCWSNTRCHCLQTLPTLPKGPHGVTFPVPTLGHPGLTPRLAGRLVSETARGQPPWLRKRCGAKGGSGSRGGFGGTAAMDLAAADTTPLGPEQGREGCGCQRLLRPVAPCHTASPPQGGAGPGPLPAGSHLQLRAQAAPSGRTPQVLSAPRRRLAPQNNVENSTNELWEAEGTHRRHPPFCRVPNVGGFSIKHTSRQGENRRPPEATGDKASHRPSPGPAGLGASPPAEQPPPNSWRLLLRRPGPGCPVQASRCPGVQAPILSSYRGPQGSCWATDQPGPFFTT